LICLLGFLDRKNSVVHHSSNETTAGFLQLERANVRWILSINYDLVPENIKLKVKEHIAVLLTEGNEIEFSEGFTDLHTEI
jgi:UDP-N-acetyl-2-amino-2-deoxyglucuronate dehydrogenase